MGELQFLEKMLGNIIRPIIRESVEEVIPKYFEKKVQRRYSIKEFCEKFGIAESSLLISWMKRLQEERSANTYTRRERREKHYNLLDYGETILRISCHLRS